MQVNQLHPIFAAEATGVDFAAPTERQPVQALHDLIHR